MAQTPKITTGANDRPRNETIAQTGEGIPDDTGAPVSVDDAAIERVKSKLFGESQPGGATPGGSANPDAVPAGTPASAENICRRCAGSGKLQGGSECPDCGGSGKVVTPVGGGG